MLPRYEAASGRVSARSEFRLLEILGKQKAPAQIEQGLFHSWIRFYFTLAKMITSVYSASDSIRARPRISAS